MLNSVRVQRFKSLEDVTLTLGERLTVLVGPNNAGKSSLLQAIQFAVSVVQSVDLDGSGRWLSEDTLSGTLAADQLVYTPLRDVQTLALGGVLRQTAASAISVEFTSPDDTASISVRRGKNKNISIQCTSQTLAMDLASMDAPFSVIAPGLAGIPAYEEYRSEGIVRRAAARGDANSVFRNVLWILHNDPAGWEAFHNRLWDVFPDISIEVSFDPATDEHIKATTRSNWVTLPIDASGTGVLQAAQVLAYVGVYSPQLLILDEPDAHLHPDNQRKLIRLLERLAEEEGLQVLLSTHSRHILDEAARLGSEVRWVSGGSIRSERFDMVQSLMDLGALDAGDRLRAGATDWVVLTEDSNLKPVRAVLSAAGFDLESTDVWSYASCTQLGAATALGRFISENAPGTRILVHRDRDYLSDDEFSELETKLSAAGICCFSTPGTDIESFFLTADHVSMVYSDIRRDEIEKLVADATAETADESRKAIINARVSAAHRQRKDGQKQPDTGKIALEAQADYDADPTRWRHGKKVLKRLNTLAQERFGKMRNLFVATDGLPIDELRRIHDQAVADAHTESTTTESGPEAT